MLYSAPLPKFHRDLRLLSLAGLLPFSGSALRQRLYCHRHRWGLGLVGFFLGIAQGNLMIAAAVGLVIYGQQSHHLGPQVSSFRRLGLSVTGAINSYGLLALWQATHSPLMSIVVVSQLLILWLILAELQSSAVNGTRAPGTLLQLAATFKPQLTAALAIEQSSPLLIDPCPQAPTRVMAARPVEYVEYEDI